MICPEGRIAVDCAFEVDPGLADLPRLGVTMTLPDELPRRSQGSGAARWNPTSTAIAPPGSGRFAATRHLATYVPYAMPQEHGNKTELRWIELASAHAAVRFTPGAPCEGSATRFAPKDLFAAKHTTDLPPRAAVRVNLDVAQRGLGTASCGPDTLDRYRIGPGEHRLAFKIEVRGDDGG